MDEPDFLQKNTLGSSHHCRTEILSFEMQVGISTCHMRCLEALIILLAPPGKATIGPLHNHWEMLSTEMPILSL